MNAEISCFKSFPDADLAILGRSPEEYKVYTQQVRKEYYIYPDLVYRPGRKKVLIHFLENENIFKTLEFQNYMKHRHVKISSGR